MLVAGVNGSGKTTTIGKLGRLLRTQRKRVMFVAADTFRAAAAEQLGVWAERSGAEFVRGREGSDPASVVYDGLSAAKARNVDVVIIDTAGRLQTKTNLMEELKKIGRIIERETGAPPDETLLVVDGTTGQNAISQARLFNAATKLTGVVVTKLDSTAKGRRPRRDQRRVGSARSNSSASAKISTHCAPSCRPITSRRCSKPLSRASRPHKAPHRWHTSNLLCMHSLVKELEVADDRAAALGNALAQIERQFGKGSIMKMGDFSKRLAIEAIPTGSIALDLALGVGGVPRGRVVEIYGPESSGKTTLALHIIAEAQKTGGTAAFVDVEHALDPTYAHGLGVDLDNLLVSQPDTGEQALDIAEMLVRSNAVDVVVVDSVAALVTKAELEGDMGDTHVGLASALDVAGAAQTDGGNLALEVRHDLHQSVAREGRRDVRQPRDDLGRPGAQILCVGAP